MRHSLRLETKEARAAVAIAREAWPLIDPRGIGDYDMPYPDNDHSFDNEEGLHQVAVAIEYLTQRGAVEKTSSYAFKHVVERWAGDNGFLPYVSNGAVIVAAIYLDVAYDGDFDGGFWIG